MANLQALRKSVVRLTVLIMQRRKKMEKLQAQQERPTDRPSRCTSLYVECEQFTQMFAAMVQEFAKFLAQDLNALKKELAGVLDQRFVLFKNKALWFDRDVAGIYPRWDKVDLPRLPYLMDAETVKKYHTWAQEGLDFSCMTQAEARKTFRKGSGNPYDPTCVVVDLPQGEGYGTWYDIQSDRFYDSGKVFDYAARALFVPIHRLYDENASPMTYPDALFRWLIMGLLPEGLTNEQEAHYMMLADASKKIQSFLDLEDDYGGRDEIFVVDSERFCKEVMEGGFTETVLSHNFNFSAVLHDACSGEKAYTGFVDSLKERLLHCDELRANIQPYEEQLLTDVNRGHWDLFEVPEDRDACAEVQMPAATLFYARPPQLDVRQNGTCAIDFGTKSTVVVCRDGEARMLRIGKGDYAKAPTMRDFENPTVVELRDIEGFLAAYRKRSGRPFTEWNQATASHQAAEAIFREQEGLGSAIYNSVFSELKQWACEEESWPILMDLQGNTREIKPYKETSCMDDGAGGGDFDPIELYAYYLGLYINNMHHQIYLDYIMSFPVNYTKDVCERIRASFERGIRKSLPPALLRDDKQMSFFRVYIGASEPAAYAISALEGFGLEPKAPGEKVAYGVFDFGGGTTDFDFGIEYVPKNGKRNFIIEQFGFGGDKLLGGENILALLAYEAYTANLTTMREKKIPFALPAGSDIFAGAETLVARTKDASAHMNRRILAEKLRPLWENDAESIENLMGDSLNVTLFSRVKEKESGSYKVGTDLHVDIDKLREVIEDRIGKGVENFFQALLHAFREKNVSPPIHIFLAGNSCRSPVVKKMFEKYIEKEEAKFAEMILKDGQEKDASGAFMLHLPLGLEEETAAEAEAALEPVSLGLDFDRKRTGKTGVAFGLLRCRRGGKDVKIINSNVDNTGEMLFPYYLGDAGRQGKYFTVRIGKGVGYGAWSYFTGADEPEFEIYYTSEPRSLQNQIPIAQVQMVRCLFDAADVSDDDDVGVYIRKTAPNVIEYAVGRKEDFEKEAARFDAEFSGKIYSKSL